MVLCLILGIGMGGGDVKIFTALAPIFAYPGTFMFYIPKYVLYLIAISMILAAIAPIFRILFRYWRDIIPSACYLATVIGILRYLVSSYDIPYAPVVFWGYIILSIFISRKVPKYNQYSKKLGYLFPIYLISIYIIDKDYFINSHEPLTSLIYICEIALISIVIYAITGVEVSDTKHVNELKEGDILRDIIVIDGDKVEVKNLNIIKRIKFLLEHELKRDNKEIILTDGEGLSEEDLQKIRKLYEEGKIPERLNILKAYPFVPFVVLGYLITLLLVKVW